MDNRTKILATSVNKLYRRGAERNIRKILSKTHDVDVAEVLESMATDARISIFQLIDSVEDQARVLSHLTKGTQEEIAHVLEISQLQSLLSNMESDDAADLLGHLPEEMAQKILTGLKKDELQNVEELMAYPDDSAGGLMGSEFLTMMEDLSVATAIQQIQNQDEDSVSFYIYVINDSQQLVGVLSLKQLLLSRPNDILKEIMSSDVISVDVATDQTDVAQLVERYDFLSLPVVENTNQLVGIITVDDVIDVIREEAEEDFYAMGMTGVSLEESVWTHIKARLPWLILAFLGGGICFSLLWHAFGQGESGARQYVALLPFVFLTISTLSNQTVTMIVGVLRNTKLKGPAYWQVIQKECVIGFLMTLLSVVVFFAILFVARYWFPLPGAFSALLGLQLVTAVLVSIGVPLGLARMNFDPIVSAPSMSLILSNIMAMVFLVVYYAVDRDFKHRY